MRGSGGTVAVSRGGFGRPDEGTREPVRVSDLFPRCDRLVAPGAGPGSGGTVRLGGEGQRQRAQDRAGIRRLGRPVAELVEQARCTGGGHLSPDDQHRPGETL
jgi:hypothetical protein